MAEKPVVFISYSHDSETHRERVLSLAQRLRAEAGIEVWLDQYEEHRLDVHWPEWMVDGIDQATHVLVVCTEGYYQRFRGHEEPDAGRGVHWEGAIIKNELYESKGRSGKFLAVFMDAGNEDWIPNPLRNRTNLDQVAAKRFTKLCDLLLGRGRIVPARLGGAQQPDGFSTEVVGDEPGDGTPPSTQGPNFDERREATTPWICSQFESDQVAFFALVESSPEWLEEPSDGWQVASLVESMWALPLTKLLELMNETHIRLNAEEAPKAMGKPVGSQEIQEAAMTVEMILKRMVPQRVVDEVVWSADESNGGLVLRIQAAKKPWAELTAAGYFDREWQLDPGPNGLVSRAEVTPPLPLFNRIDTSGGLEALALLAKHLCALPFEGKQTLPRNSFMQLDDREELVTKRGPSEVDWLEVCEILNSELELEARELRFNHYLVLPSNFVERHSSFVELLKNQLSHLHLLVLETPVGGRRNESRNVSLIYRVLTRGRSDGGH